MRNGWQLGLARTRHGTLALGVRGATTPRGLRLLAPDVVIKKLSHTYSIQK